MAFKDEYLNVRVYITTVLRQYSSLASPSLSLLRSDIPRLMSRAHASMDAHIDVPNPGIRTGTPLDSIHETILILVCRPVSASAA